MPAILITISRQAIAYPFYALASLLTIDYKNSDRRSYYLLAALVIWFGGTFIVINTQHSLAPAGFALEMVLIFPLLLFLSDFKSSFSQADALLSIRTINLICMIYSLITLIEYGFPFQLPYIDYSSDTFWGPYGWGGSRILTVFGFTGFLFELTASSHSRWRLFWIMVALCNFVAPSYIMGICCGLAALSLIAIRKPLALILLCILLIPSGKYALDRLEHITATKMSESSGFQHPKILAYTLVYDMYSQEKSLLPTGTGLGQFTSTPQIWVSKPLRSVSKQSVPPVPGLFTSALHREYMEPTTKATYSGVYYRSSALEKPYTGFSSLAAETGLFFCVMAFLFLKRGWKICAKNIMALPFFAFFIALNTIDQWIDNLWLGYCLLLVSPFFVPDKQRAKPAPEIPD